MQLGKIRLGRMGTSTVRRLLRDGHACVVHDVRPSDVAGLVHEDAAGAASLKQTVSQLGWRRSSVIGSSLLDMTTTALLKDSELAGNGGRVSDSAEGRWPIQAVIDVGAPVPVLRATLNESLTARSTLLWALCGVANPRHSWAMAVVCALQRIPNQGTAHPQGLVQRCLSAALFERFTSRGDAHFAHRNQSAMRYEFGGHVEKPAP